MFNKYIYHILSSDHAEFARRDIGDVTTTLILPLIEILKFHWLKPIHTQSSLVNPDTLVPSKIVRINEASG
jgi:hypothetical protein